MRARKLNRGLRISCVLPVLLLLCSFSDAQQNLDLDEALNVGMSKNVDMKGAKLQQHLSMAEETAAREWWLPNISAGTQIHQLWGSAMNGDGNFFTDVNRRNMQTGLGMNLEWDFGNGLFGQRAAALQAEAQQYSVKARRNRVRLEIVQAWYDLIGSQKFYEAYQQLALQADTIALQLGIQVDAGLLFESDHLLAKSHSSHLRINSLNAKAEAENAQARLARLLNISPGTPIVLRDTSMKTMPFPAELRKSPPTDSAYKKRPEVMAMQKAMLAMEQQRKVTVQGNRMPRIEVNAYGSMFGDVLTPQYATGVINAGLHWDIPLGDISSRGRQKTMDAKMAIAKNEMSHFQIRVNEEVRVSVGLLHAAQQQMEIASSGNSNAAKALSQCLQRQHLGLVRPFELFQAQEIFIQAKLDYLRALTAYNKAWYRYQYAIGAEF